MDQTSTELSHHSITDNKEIERAGEEGRGRGKMAEREKKRRLIQNTGK